MSDYPYFIEVFGKTCVAIVCDQFCDVINFEIYLSFLIKPFSSMAKSSKQKLKYLKKEGSFSCEIKTTVRPDSVPLKWQNPLSRVLPKKHIRGTNMHLHLHSTNAETDIQWFSWKYIHALKLHTNVKVHAFGLIDTMGLFNIMRFNIISICGIPEKYYY